MRFDGKVAIVTGGGSGLGAETSRHLARLGARVAMVDVNEEGVNEVAAGIRAEGGSAIAACGDVRKSADATRTVGLALKEFGAVHILVNNAGLVKDAQLKNMTEEMWDHVLDVDLTGVFNFSWAALPHMRRQRYGKIVSIASRALLGNFGQTNYSSAKAGIAGFTRALALEVGPDNVNVNCIAPGFVPTPASMGTDPQVAENAKKAAPLRRAGTPADIANAVEFLVSESASFITGQILFVCGGRSIVPALELWA